MKLGEKRGGCAADGRHCLLGVQLCTSAEGAGEGGAADGNHCLFLRSHPGPQSGPTLALGGVESAKTLHNHFLTEMCSSRGQHKGGLVFLSSTLAPCLLTSCCRKGK